MKYYVLIALATLAINLGCSNGFLMRSDEYNEETRDFLLLPDENNNLQFVKLTRDAPETRYDPKRDVKFNLYTRKNADKPQSLKVEDLSTITNSNYDPSKPTRLICHGWMTGPTADFNVKVREAYLKYGDYNVIVIDWFAGASALDYSLSRKRVPGVANRIFYLIDLMVKNSLLKLNDLHMVGHSLGAHVVGIAGRHVTNNLNDKIHTVIGLDPALPLFSVNQPLERISTDSAHYVEIIHTNGGNLAFLSPLGHADFYPNGGFSQPGCILDITGLCSHFRSYDYFIEAFKASTFVSYNCQSYQEMLNYRRCTVVNEMAKMGSENGATTNNGKASGVYLSKTNSQSPFSRVPDASATIVKF
uniref:Putative pancreatic lipase-like enzyme n=1 Tax=Xenopsylla cheopis TaxID=163159 RepID=A0A6M2DX94_XENCH